MPIFSVKYQNRRPEYVSNWWNVVDWDKVSVMNHSLRSKNVLMFSRSLKIAPTLSRTMLEYQSVDKRSSYTKYLQLGISMVD